MKTQTKVESLRRKLVKFLIEYDISDTDLEIINAKQKESIGLDKSLRVYKVKTIDDFDTEYLTESTINRMIFRMVKGLYPTEKELYLMRAVYFKAIHDWINRRYSIESTYPRLVRMLAFWEFISDHRLNEKEAQELFLSIRYGRQPVYDFERLKGFDKLKETWRENIWNQL